MNLRDHTFVRETPPLDSSAYCPDCGEPWRECCCDLPEFAEVLETYEGAPQ